MIRTGTLLASAALLVGALTVNDAAAQQGAQGGNPQGASPQGGAASMPPALQAAVTSGNAQAVQQAIATLSGGNPQRAGALAEAAIAAAEKMVATNPQAAIAVAGSAVQTIRAASVQQGAPASTQNVVTAAARILSNPDIQRVAPDQVTQVGASVVNAAGTTKNPTLTATVAQSVIAVAEKMVAVNPAGAVQLAAAAMQTVRDTAVLQSSPTQCLAVATSAARIVVQPTAQAVAPQAIAAMATAAAAVATTPAVYQVAPAAAINVMANSYAAATSPTIVAAVPSVTNDVRANLTAASQTDVLNRANPTNPAAINKILAGEDPTSGKPLHERVSDTPPRDDKGQNGSPS